jgi:CheY-like chemotaxis protein
MAKILLVEDDKSLREIYGVRLMAEGYEIVSAGDGEEALAMAIKERPDLIVSDVMMPKISGFDMLDILRSTTETKHVKVIMMTALSSEDQRARGEALGADRYLVKSQVGIEDVVRTVHDVLGDGVAQPAPAPVFAAAEPLQAPAPAPAYAEPFAAAAPFVPQAPEPAYQPTAGPVPMPTPPEQSYGQPTPVEAPVAYTAPELVAQALVPQPMQPEAPAYAPVAAPAPYQAPAAAFTPEPFAAPAFSMPAPTPAPAPAFDQAPAAASVPSPFAAPAPVPTPMPQPIAPFSTPAPASLGERVIEPLTNPAAQTASAFDLSSQIEQALNNQGTPPAPTPPTV